MTIDTQTQSKSDLAMSKKIREAIIADKSVPSYARNVKVITVNGAASLKGLVHSQEEKLKVEADAAAVAGSASDHERTDGEAVG